MKSLLTLFLLCAATTTALLPPPPIKVLVRKEVGNPADYFDKTFAQYKEGFSANGWLKKKKHN